jgi:hypothetical protein
MDSESIISLSIVFMTEPENFYNRGFGWICKKCELGPSAPRRRSRLMREGETENKTPAFSNTGMARWTNDERTTLECPNCGMHEKISE